MACVGSIRPGDLDLCSSVVEWQSQFLRTRAHDADGLTERQSDRRTDGMQYM